MVNLLQAYFKFIPLYIGLPLLGGIVLLYQIRAGLTASTLPNEKCVFQGYIA